MPQSGAFIDVEVNVEVYFCFKQAQKLRQHVCYFSYTYCRAGEMATIGGATRKATSKRGLLWKKRVN